jgi:hypothetical protein
MFRMDIIKFSVMSNAKILTDVVTSNQRTGKYDITNLNGH